MKFSFWNFLLKKRTIKLYFQLPSNVLYANSRRNTGSIDFFSVNHMENNDASRNKEGTVYFEHITFSALCNSAKDILN